MTSVSHDAIWEEIRELHLLAFRLKEQFDQHQDLAAIRAAWQPLRAKQERLGKKLPEVVLEQQGQYERHFYWVEKRLREGDTESCYGDLASLCFADIPTLEQAYLTHLLGSRAPATTDWEAVHPLIRSCAHSRFESHHYADAVEAAFKEINALVKHAYRAAGGEEKDGADLMRNAFSYQRNFKTHAVERMPLLRLTNRDLATDSGFNVQDGYMNLFAGAMRGIRNPKAHDNVTIDKAEAWEILLFASHLLRMWDRGGNK